MCRRQIADHANNFWYFTDIWKTRVSYQKSLNKKFHWAHFSDSIFFTWKNRGWKQKLFKYKYMLIEYVHFFLNNKIFNWKKNFFSLNINIYYFRLKKYWRKKCIFATFQLPYLTKDYIIVANFNFLKLCCKTILYIKYFIYFKYFI